MRDAASYSEQHPHEPEIPPALDAEGRCLVCGLLVKLDAARDEIERRAAENARLQDGVSVIIKTIYGAYEQAQATMRKPSPGV